MPHGRRRPLPPPPALARASRLRHLARLSGGLAADGQRACRRALGGPHDADSVGPGRAGHARARPRTRRPRRAGHARAGLLASAALRPSPPAAPRVARRSPEGFADRRGPGLNDRRGRPLAFASGLQTGDSGAAERRPSPRASLAPPCAPLAGAELGERLLALARRAHVAAVGVFVADQSRKSRTANAAVVGIGRTRRIIVFDTLLTGFTPEEIESVLAHELGHHVHGDIRRGLLVHGVLLLVTARLAALGLDAGVPLLGLAGPPDPAGLPWLGLVLLALGLIQLPLGNGFSRWIERQADDFALATTGNAPAFIGAMERLALLNLAERRPNRLKEIVFYSHPALERR